MMSYIRMNGEVVFQDRPNHTRETILHSGDRVHVKGSVLTRPGHVGTVVHTQGSGVLVQFDDRKRLHYWRHELETAAA